MGVVVTKSRAITNRDATPRVLNNSSESGSRVQSFCGSLETVSGDSIGSTYIFGSIPSNARMESLRLYSEDVGTTAAGDVGLYKTTADGSAVVDADFFASAVDIHSGALNGSDILFESGVIDVGNAHKMVWELLGLSADPGINYDVVMTLTAASDAAASIHLKGQYVI